MVSVSRVAGARRTRARHVHPVLGLRPAAAGPSACSPRSPGSSTGSSLVRHRDDPARVAVDDRDRAAPVALSREAPVAQAVVDREPAAALGRELLDDRAAALGRGQAVELGRVDEQLALGVLDVRRAPRRRRRRRPHDLADRQVECRREVEVALVVRRHGHDRARPVVDQDVVGDEDGSRSPFTGLTAWSPV